MNLSEIEFGDTKKEYGVTENSDGTITVNVYHKNQKVRAEIINNRENPSYFIKFADYKSPNLRAKHHLARVVRNYRSKFLNNAVIFFLK